MIEIEVYGKADEEICSGCDHDCGSCAPGDKKKTIDLFNEFSALLNNSELKGLYRASFFESSPENIARNKDVERLLSMAKLEPVICIDGAVTYLGGFSPEGLLFELNKKALSPKNPSK